MNTRTPRSWQPLNWLPTLVFLAWLLPPLAAIHAAVPSQRPPNIVFIFADDWGWGDLSCHGHPWLKTPNLDQLAGAGIDFQQFNVLNPVCSPSRTAATTGMFPARFCIHEHFAPGINTQRGMPDWLDPRAPTLPRFLKGAGYRTGHFGKWHLTNSGSAGAPSRRPMASMSRRFSTAPASKRACTTRPTTRSSSSAPTGALRSM